MPFTLPEPYMQATGPLSSSLGVYVERRALPVRVLPGRRRLARARLWPAPGGPCLVGENQRDSCLPSPARGAGSAQGLAPAERMAPGDAVLTDRVMDTRTRKL